MTRERARGRVPIPPASDRPFLRSLLSGKSSILEGVWGMLREWSPKVGKKRHFPSFFVFELYSCCKDSLPFFFFRESSHISAGLTTVWEEDFTMTFLYFRFNITL